MIRHLRHHGISIRHALDGILWAFTSQPNFTIHLLISFFVLLLAFILNISNLEFAILVLTILFGLGIEMVNTSIESVTDLVTSEWKKEAKIAKDVAAGMMLLTAVGAVITGLIIFLPHLL